MGSMKELTSEQRQAVQQLRRTVIDESLKNYDDKKLLKFLIARKYDVKSAAGMLQTHLFHWNKFKLHNILSEYTPDEKFKFFLTAPLGFDKEGSMVRLIHIGQSDLRGLVLSHAPHESLRYAAYLLAKDKTQQTKNSEETGQETDDKQIYLIDLQGLPWRIIFSRPLADRFLYLLHVYEANYPESLKTVYIVNAPSFFNLIYNFIKKVLPNEIVSKIEVLSTKEHETVLSQIMDPAILPAFLGGTRTDASGDPNCLSLFEVPPGTPVPEELYNDAEENWLDSEKTAKKITILNQQTFKVELEVTEPDCTIIWDFKTVANDIGMGLFLRKEDAEPKNLIATHRVDCQKYIESGRYHCEETGTYVILFDNSYSWFAKKELTYRACVLNAKEAEKLDEVIIT